MYGSRSTLYPRIGWLLAHRIRLPMKGYPTRLQRVSIGDAHAIPPRPRAASASKWFEGVAIHFLDTANVTHFDITLNKGMGLRIVP